MSKAGLQHEVVLFDKLKVEIHARRDAAAEAAANAAAEALLKITGARQTFGVIFATGNSQLATLREVSRSTKYRCARSGGPHGRLCGRPGQSSGFISRLPARLSLHHSSYASRCDRLSR